MVIALPALLAIRKRYPSESLIMVTTPQIAPFVASLNVFDRILFIDDRNLISIFLSALHTLLRLRRIDTFIDFEIHSRLSATFVLLSRARNRIAFYREEAKNRLKLVTHPIAFNFSEGIYLFFDQIAQMLDAETPSDIEVRNHFINHNKLVKKSKPTIDIAIGCGCSDLSKERMLTAQLWCQHFSKSIQPQERYRLVFLGDRKDFQVAANIISVAEGSFKNSSFINLCGTLTLMDSIQELYNCDAFWGIDSSLLHYARLLGIPTEAYFGPTDPKHILKPMNGIKEIIYYQALECSPCVHLKEASPCGGNNQCIQRLFS